ncbi:MAG: CtsR family transcriptional regulator [Oscillospiraceae bacterium]|jgi:transcriptional regulator CtsR|nr:CtsR family transcriptional regulator [Oscillospiraceae bacterium]
MNISSTIAQMILEMLEEGGDAEIQRNVLAQSIGCVPSQINYVIASRFSPEQGYIVESRRGGGGYIRIRRVRLEGQAAFMQLINAIGRRLDEGTCRAHTSNLAANGFLSAEAALLLLAATSEAALRGIPVEWRETARAGIFKQQLLAANEQYSARP